MCLQQILDNKIIKYAIYICVVLLVISTTTCAIDKMDMLDNYSNEEGYIDWASIIFGKTTLNETKVILLADNSVRESSIRINDLFVGAFNSTDTLCFNYIDTINFLILGKYDCIYFTELGNDIIATGIRFYRS